MRKIPEVQLLREQQQLLHSLHTPAPQMYCMNLTALVLSALQRTIEFLL